MAERKSRRALNSEATREALLAEATRLFAERGYAATSLDQIAEATLVTRGAVYHHYAGKQALFEAVLDRLGAEVIKRTRQVAAAHVSPVDGALAALNAFLSESCDPVYGRLIWQEGPIALGWDGWRRCEQEHSYALVSEVVNVLMDLGYLESTARTTTIRVFYELLSGVGLAIAEAAESEKARVRDECSDLLQRMVVGLLREPNTVASALAGTAYSRD